MRGSGGVGRQGVLALKFLLTSGEDDAIFSAQKIETNEPHLI